MYCINFETLCAENDNVKTIYKGTLEDFHKSHTAEIWMKITSINWSSQKVKFKSLILFHNDYEKSYNKWFQSFRIAPMTAIMCCSCGRKPEEPGGNPPVWHGKRLWQSEWKMFVGQRCQTYMPLSKNGCRRTLENVKIPTLICFYIYIYIYITKCSCFHLICVPYKRIFKAYQGNKTQLYWW